MTRVAVGLVVSVALLGTVCRQATGEVFVLRSGGRVVGELLNPDEIPRKKFIVKTAAGAQVTLDRSQVKQVLHPRP